MFLSLKIIAEFAEGAFDTGIVTPDDMLNLSRPILIDREGRYQRISPDQQKSERFTGIVTPEEHSAIFNEDEVWVEGPDRKLKALERQDAVRHEDNGLEQRTVRTDGSFRDTSGMGPEDERKVQKVRPGLSNEELKEIFSIAEENRRAVVWRKLWRRTGFRKQEAMVKKAAEKQPAVSGQQLKKEKEAREAKERGRIKSGGNRQKIARGGAAAGKFIFVKPVVGLGRLGSGLLWRWKNMALKVARVLLALAVAVTGVHKYVIDLKDLRQEVGAKWYELWKDEVVVTDIPLVPEEGFQLEEEVMRPVEKETRAVEEKPVNVKVIKKSPGYGGDKINKQVPDKKDRSIAEKHVVKAVEKSPPKEEIKEVDMSGPVEQKYLSFINYYFEVRKNGNGVQVYQAAKIRFSAEAVLQKYRDKQISGDEAQRQFEQLETAVRSIPEN